jgi:hypothetical protein
MKLKILKSKKKAKVRARRRIRIIRKKPTRRRISRPSKSKAIRSRKPKRIRIRRAPVSTKQIQSPEHEKALAALALMRRAGLSLSKATKLQRIKPRTFLRHVGSAVHRSGPGKPWKATATDNIKAQMRVLTPKGPVMAVVRGSVERKRLSQYEFALRQFRAAEVGADKELEKFKGLTVGGHVLVTDLNELIQLEEAGKLDFDNLYYSVGGGS